MHQDAAKTKTDALLKDLWARKLPLVRDHLNVLEVASEMIDSGRLTEFKRNRAAMSAHKLAGSLGMFGYPDGTHCARKLEQLLEADVAPPAGTFRLLLEELRKGLLL